MATSSSSICAISMGTSKRHSSRLRYHSPSPSTILLLPILTRAPTWFFCLLSDLAENSPFTLTHAAFDRQNQFVLEWSYTASGPGEYVFLNDSHFPGELTSVFPRDGYLLYRGQRVEIVRRVGVAQLKARASDEGRAV